MRARYLLSYHWELDSESVAHGPECVEVEVVVVRASRLRLANVTTRTRNVRVTAHRN
jgi:hypothetical protein